VVDGEAVSGKLLGPASYADAVPKLFAWADADVHEETYDDAEYDQYKSECLIWDEGDPLYSEPFGDWRRSRTPEGIRPYASDGEIDHFRIELTLNELGNAFLVVDQFATEGVRQLIDDRERTGTLGSAEPVRTWHRVSARDGSRRG
jgi:hypothetical protein